MKNEKLNDLDEFDFLYEEIEPQFHQDIMVQQLEKRRTIILPNEISKRKKIIKKMFETRFGKKLLKDLTFPALKLLKSKDFKDEHSLKMLSKEFKFIALKLLKSILFRDLHP